MMNMNELAYLTSNPNLTAVGVGSGLRWADAYDFLEPYGRTAIGGRVGEIGLLGLILGGGL
jgi:hypothetical protein